MDRDTFKEEDCNDVLFAGTWLSASEISLVHVKMHLNINTKYVLLFKYQTDQIPDSTDYMIDMKRGTDYVMISDR